MVVKVSLCKELSTKWNAQKAIENDVSWKILGRAFGIWSNAKRKVSLYEAEFTEGQNVFYLSKTVIITEQIHNASSLELIFSSWLKVGFTVVAYKALSVKANSGCKYFNNCTIVLSSAYSKRWKHGKNRTSHVIVEDLRAQISELSYLVRKSRDSQKGDTEGF